MTDFTEIPPSLDMTKTRLIQGIKPWMAGARDLLVTMTIIIALVIFIDNEWMTFRHNPPHTNVLNIGIAISLLLLSLFGGKLFPHPLASYVWTACSVFAQALTYSLLLITPFAPLISALLAAGLWAISPQPLSRKLSAMALGGFIFISAFELMDALLLGIALVFFLANAGWWLSQRQGAYQHRLVDGAWGLTLISLLGAIWLSYHKQSPVVSLPFESIINQFTLFLVALMPVLTTLGLVKLKQAKLPWKHAIGIFSAPVLFGLLWFTQPSIAMAFTYAQVGLGIQRPMLRFISIVALVGYLAQFYTLQTLGTVDKHIILLITGIILLVVYQLIKWLIPQSSSIKEAPHE